MMKAVIPDVKLMTRRDHSLEMMFSTEALNNPAPFPELVIMRKQLKEAETLRANTEVNESARQAGRVPFDGWREPALEESELPELRERIEKLKGQIERMEEEVDLYMGKVCYLLAKREGFLIGVKYAASIIHRSPDEMLKLLCAMGDESFADQLLHDISKDLPDPYTNEADYFRPNAPAPVQAMAQAAPAQQEGGDVE